MKPRNIPSLDGLRALSVGMVVAAHIGGVISQKLPAIPFWFYMCWGSIGVQTFFVISGFLITLLLLKELNTTGTISLGRFYFRRALRIFPPFYAYLAVSLALTLAGVFAGELRAFIVAGTYTTNYLGGGSELLEHTWTLSLEEQFYLLWPAALLLLGTRKSIKVAIWLILLSPPSRIVTYYLAPHHRSFVGGMLHSGLDSIMFGCLLALLWDNLRFNQFVQPLVSGWVATLSGLFVLVLSPIVQSHFRGSYSLVIGFTLNAICISQILLYVVRVPHSALGWVLNTRVLRHLGVISYGLYLWQHMFTRSNTIRFAPWNVLAILVCAELSHWLIEKPSFRLRDELERTVPWKRTIPTEPLKGYSLAGVGVAHPSPVATHDGVARELDADYLLATVDQGPIGSIEHRIPGKLLS
jgi:peptidoglycan/LPS O-acetylase OafA/YrhL